MTTLVRAKKKKRVLGTEFEETNRACCLGGGAARGHVGLKLYDQRDLKEAILFKGVGGPRP